MTTSSDPEERSSRDASAVTTSTSTTPSSSSSSSSSSAAAAASPPLTRDQRAELELHEFLANIVETSDNHEGRSSRSTTSASSSSSTSMAPESLFPSEMSCRDAFDSAFYCQSPGGQFMNVYRYGQLRDCADHWRAFWFCMRTRSHTDLDRQHRIRAFYRERAAKYKVGPSSEDVWSVRTEPVVGAFQQEPPPEIDDRVVESMNESSHEQRGTTR